MMALSLRLFLTTLILSLSLSLTPLDAWALESGNQIIDQIEQANQLPETTVGKFVLVEAPELNAYTDGKDVYATSALWNKLTSTNERAFVLSHEMGHIMAHHNQQTGIRRVGLSLLANKLNNWFGNNESPTKAKLGTLASALGVTMIDAKFSRGMEYQADDLGLQLMAKAGYQPSAALSVFKKLQAASRSHLPEFLSSHPMSESRTKALIKKHQLSLR